MIEVQERTGGERHELEIQREAEKCAYRRQMDAEKARIRVETDAEVEREVRRMKEVV